MVLLALVVAAVLAVDGVAEPAVLRCVHLAAQVRTLVTSGESLPPGLGEASMACWSGLFDSSMDLARSHCAKAAGPCDVDVLREEIRCERVLTTKGDPDYEISVDAGAAAYCQRTLDGRDAREAKKAAAAAADARALAVISGIGGPEQTERLAASALLCADVTSKAEALAEIRAEQKYAREGGGVVDMEKIRTQQVFMRGTDENAAQTRQWLSRHTLKAIPCNTPKVQYVSACISWAMYESNEKPFWELKNEASCADGSTVMNVYRNIDD